MSVITSQNWDGVTAPVLPSGWHYDGGFATGTGLAIPLSSPNLLVSVDSSESTAYYLAADSSGGQVQVSAAFTSESIKGGFGLGVNTVGSVIARAANPASPTTRTCYRATIDFFAGQILLDKIVGGTATSLHILGASLIAPYGYMGGQWFTLQLICNGTAIAVNLESPDGLWLQTDGTWGASQVNCISVTDLSVSGSGYAGLVMNPGISGESPGDVYSDNFLFESLLDPKPQTIIVPAKHAWWLRD
ncbi:MAG: hypothetical protein P4L84_33615 [Isosphaeraceae bacterium]|nr:hypothetical protein [Isosphaeraceae bacterium]